MLNETSTAVRTRSPRQRARRWPLLALLALVLAACGGSEAVGIDVASPPEVAIGEAPAPTEPEPAPTTPPATDPVQSTRPEPEPAPTTAPPPEPEPAPTTAPPPEPEPAPTTAPPPEPAPAPEASIRTGVYQVEIEGVVSGWSFRIPAELIVAPTIDPYAPQGGINELDFCLVAGFPAALPETGAIWFGTNTGCLPGNNGANIDMAVVSVGDGVIRAEPIEDLMSVGMNNYTAQGGITALLYLIQRGGIELWFEPDGSVSGSIGIRGYCGPCNFGAGGDGGTYEARISS